MRVRGGVGLGSGMVGVVVVVDIGGGRWRCVFGAWRCTRWVGGAREEGCARAQCSWRIEVVKDGGRKFWSSQNGGRSSKIRCHVIISKSYIEKFRL